LRLSHFWLEKKEPFILVPDKLTRLQHYTVSVKLKFCVALNKSLFRELNEMTNQLFTLLRVSHIWLATLHIRVGRIKWAGRLIRINVQQPKKKRAFIVKPERSRTTGRPSRRWAENIDIDI
jgi:AAA+ ATPase superfamily predicted ATPase